MEVEHRTQTNSEMTTKQNINDRINLFKDQPKLEWQK